MSLAGLRSEVLEMIDQTLRFWDEREPHCTAGIPHRGENFGIGAATPPERSCASLIGVAPSQCRRVARSEALRLVSSRVTLP